MKKITGILIFIIIIIIYLVSWPVPINPVSWKAPEDPGYTGPFEVNTRLAAIEKLPIKEAHGPEDIAIDADGRIYAATHEGFIVRLENSTAEPEKWVNTGVTETSQYLYIGSLITDFIARLPKDKVTL